MSHRKEADHLDPATLADYLEGKLPEDTARLVREHLGKCPLCALELKRLERFARIDADEGLARDAEWLYARAKLEARLRDKIIPSLMERSPKIVRMRRTARFTRWLMPAAAAAVLVIAVTYFAGREKPPVPVPVQGPMRGAPAVEYGIALKEPIGELKAFPDVFKWHSQRTDDHFTLEIFSADLKTIYKVERVAESSWRMPDSLRTILKPDSIYVWNVKGYGGLRRVLASPDGWFKIVPSKALVE